MHKRRDLQVAKRDAWAAIYTGTDFLEEREDCVTRLCTFIDPKLLGPNGHDQRGGA